MGNNQTLAEHIQNAALLHGSQLALGTSQHVWTFGELHKASTALANASQPETSPLIINGSNQELALYAYAASQQKRPFWPVHRSTPSSERHHLPPNLALIISTSGSEGMPRAVMLEAQQLNTAASAANKTLGLHQGDLWLNSLPLFHIGGQSILWRCAQAAAGVVLLDEFSIEGIRQAFMDHPITHISLVPAMLARLLEHQITPPASLRVALIGGAALSEHLYQRATESGWPLYPSYGMSETAAQIACFIPEDGAWHRGCVGQPMPDHEIRITDTGRIAIRGPQVMRGYLDGSCPDHESWFVTSDLGYVDEKGQLFVTGRADDMLVSGGRNVHPLEVESGLSACIGVKEVAVCGYPDPIWGDIVVAIVVGSAAEETLRTYAKETLHSAAQPRKYLFVDSLPKTITNKIDRRKIRQMISQFT